MTIEKLKEIVALAKKAAESVPDPRNASNQDIGNMLQLTKSLSAACMDSLDVRNDLKDMILLEKLDTFYRAARALKSETPYGRDQIPHIKSYINQYLRQLDGVDGMVHPP